MISDINIFQIFPRFLMEDPDGYALIKALEAGLNSFLEVAGDGLKLMLDVDSMPEWRLDELAWEYNCLYDYDADVEVKRQWIRDAYKNYRRHGTAEGIEQYLGRYFGVANVTEWFDGSGLDPGEFDVNVTGVRSDENEAWIRKAVAKAKNVRSSLNNIVYSGGESTANIKAGAVSYGIVLVEVCTML